MTQSQDITIRYPETTILRPSIGKKMLLVAGAAVFVLVGMSMLDGPKKFWGWAGIILFGSAGAMTLLQIVIGAGKIVIMKHGIGYRQFFSAKFFTWNEVSEFSTYQPSVATRVVMFSVRGKQRPLGGAVSDAIMGANMTLPTHMECDPQELAMALNIYRAAALADGAGAPQQ